MNSYATLIEKAERLEQYSLKIWEQDLHLSHTMRLKALELRRKARLLILDEIISRHPSIPLHY